MNTLAWMLVALASAAAVAGAQAPVPAGDVWPQWGGPDRNFLVADRGLAAAWPESGPPVRWRRALGAGYSAIVVDERAAYTLFRDGSRDVVVALDRDSGRTLWEGRYEAPFVETCSEQLGPVPRAAPLLTSAGGARIVTVSAGGLMSSFDRATGKPHWQVDLSAGRSREAVRACGYSTSPLAFENLVLTTAGGRGRGVVAVRADTGALVWQAQDFENAYSSPLLVDVGGRPEVIAFTYGEVSGLDPRTGALEWTHAHPADQGVNVATPVWGADGRLFVSSSYNGGSRLLRLTREATGRVAVQEVWAHGRVRIHFGNAVRLGGRIYASNGDLRAAPLVAVDVATGDTVWRERALARATLIGAGDKLVLLDEDGTLALAQPDDRGLNVLARASVLAARAWTAPTLVGTTLYVRNNSEVVALDLGR